MGKFKLSGTPPLHISASQYKTYLTCHRMWMFGSVLGKRSPETTAHVIGKKTHFLMEEWVIAGIEPEDKIFELVIPEKKLLKKKKKKQLAARKSQELDKIACKLARAIIKTGLVTRGPHNWGVEWETCPKTYFHLPCGDSVPILGFIDLLGDITNREILITDYKTMRTFEFMVESEDLIFDPQCIIYCKWVRESIMCPGEVVHFRLINVNKTNHKVVESRVCLTFEEIDKAFLEMYPNVTALRKDGKKKLTHVLPNHSACTMYGGCDNYILCHSIPYKGKEASGVTKHKTKPLRRMKIEDFKKTKK